MGASFNIPIGQISGGDVKVGDNRVVNHTTVSPPQVLQAIREVVPEGVQSNVDELIHLSEQPHTPEVEVVAHSIYDKLKPYAPEVFKVLMTFGDAALTAIASSNPIIAGLLAVFKKLKD